MNCISIPQESVAVENSSTLNRQTEDERTYLFAMAGDDADGPSPLSPESLSSTPAAGSKKRQPRKFKGRAARACFCCRARKVRCNVAECGVPCYNCQRDDVTCTVPKHRGPRRVTKQKDWRKTYFNGKYGQDAVPKLLQSKPMTSFDRKNCGQNGETEHLCQKEELPEEWDVSLDEGDIAKGLELGFRLMARFLDQFSTSLTKITTMQQQQSRPRDSYNDTSGAQSGADDTFNLWEEEIDWMGSQEAHRDLDFDFTESNITLSEDRADSFSPTPSDCHVHSPPSASSDKRIPRKPPSNTENSQVVHKCRAITALLTRAFEATIREVVPNAFEAQLPNSAFSDIGSDEGMTMSTPLDMEMPQLQPVNFLQSAERRAKDDVLAQEQIKESLTGSSLDTVFCEYGKENPLMIKDRGLVAMNEGLDGQVEGLFDGIMDYQDGESASMFRVGRDICNILL